MTPQTTKLVTKEETNVILSGLREKPWGAEEVGAKDIFIEKVLLAHSTSTVCKDKENPVPAGSIYKFPGKQIIGDAKKAFEFIPFVIKKTWTVFSDDGLSRIREEDYNSTPNAELSFKEGKDSLMRVETYNIFALEVIAKKKSVMPVLIPFSKSGFNSGKQIASHFKINDEMLKQPGCTHHWTMKTKQVTNKKGLEFIVPVLEKGTETTDEEIASAYQWYKTMQTVKIQTHDEPIEKSQTPEC